MLVGAIAVLTALGLANESKERGEVGKEHRLFPLFSGLVFIRCYQEASSTILFPLFCKVRILPTRFLPGRSVSELPGTGEGPGEKNR